MRSDVKQAYKRELALASQARNARELDVAVTHLERAHILGQRYLLPHLRTHWLLFAVASQRVDTREMVGQIVRLAAVVPGYLTGWVPKGNTGSAKVSALLPMPPPTDLVPLVATHNVGRDVALRVALWALAVFIYQAVVTPTGLEALFDS